MKNKIITWLLSTVLFFSIFSLSLGTENVAAASQEGTVTATSLQLRQSSSINSKTLTLLPKGTKVSVKETKGNWMKVYVSSKKRSGYVDKKYISVKNVTTATTASPSTTTYYVKVDSLTVMASSSRKDKVLTTIKKGDAVTYLSKKTSWGKIKTASGITGWVANRDLSTTKPADPVQPVLIDNIQYVKVNSLTVMESSSRKDKVLTTIKKGDRCHLFI